MHKSKYFKQKFEAKRQNIALHKPKIVNAKVVNILNNLIEVELDDGTCGICELNEITDFNNKSLTTRFKKDFYYKFLVIRYNDYKKIYYLSYKALHPEEIRKKHVPVPTASHYRNLYHHLSQCIQNYQSLNVDNTHVNSEE